MSADQPEKTDKLNEFLEAKNQEQIEVYDLKRLNELHAATTPGEWHAVQYADNWCLQDGPDYGDRQLDGGDCDEEWECRNVPTDEGGANMRFVAEAHNARPAVAAELAAAREQMEATEDALTMCRKSHATLMRGIRVAVGLDHWPEGSGPFPAAAISLLNGHLEKQAARLEVLEKFVQRVCDSDKAWDSFEARWNMSADIAWLDAETKKVRE